MKFGSTTRLERLLIPINISLYVIFFLPDRASEMKWLTPAYADVKTKEEEKQSIPCESSNFIQFQSHFLFLIKVCKNVVGLRRHMKRTHKSKQSSLTRDSGSGSNTAEDDMETGEGSMVR